MKNKLINEYLYDYVNALNDRDEMKTSLRMTRTFKQYYVLDFLVLLFVCFLCYTSNSLSVLIPYLTFKTIMLISLLIKDLMQKRSLTVLERDLANIDDDLISVRYVLKNDTKSGTDV